MYHEYLFDSNPCTEIDYDERLLERADNPCQLADCTKINCNECPLAPENLTIDQRLSKVVTMINKLRINEEDL
jgi:hypothetical protein